MALAARQVASYTRLAGVRSVPVLLCVKRAQRTHRTVIKASGVQPKSTDSGKAYLDAIKGIERPQSQALGAAPHSSPLAHPLVAGLKKLLFGRLGLLQLAAAVALPLAGNSSNPFSHLWQAYCVSLIAHPMTTKIATGAVGTVLGDLLAQITQYRSAGAANGFQYEPMRCIRLLFFNVAVATPWAIFWYNLLDKMILPGQEGTKVMVSKMFVDQFIAAPFFISIFLMASKVLEGKAGDAIPFMKSTLKPTLIANWKLWPLAMLFNFSIVPPDMRILFVNVVALFWTMYLSLAVNSPKKAAA